MINLILGALLSLNVLAAALYLTAHNAALINYINVFGCVVFGVWIAKRLK